MRVTQAGKKYGWDAPLTLEIAATSNALAEAFSNAAPVGKHEHDRVRGEAFQHRARTAKRQTEFPRHGGRLRDWLDKSQNWQVVMRRGSFHHASISIFLAYAAIIDMGGNVPATGMPSKMVTKGQARAMSFNVSGGDVVTRYRRGFTIQRQDYVDRGFKRFMSATGRTGGITVGWRPSTNAD